MGVIFSNVHFTEIYTYDMMYNVIRFVWGQRVTNPLGFDQNLTENVPYSMMDLDA